MHALFSALLFSAPGLVVNAPPECITAEELAASVEAEIGPFVAPLHIQVERIEARGWRARIDSSAGTRSIEERGADCRALDRPLVLMVALIAEPPPSPAPLSPRASEEVQPVSVRFGLDAAIAVGALPDPAPGGRINGAIGFPLGPVSLWIELGFTGWRPSEMMVSQPSQTLESSTSRIDADLDLCALAPLDDSIEIGGCAGARFGRLAVGGEINGTIDNPFDDDQSFTRGGEDERFLLAASVELRAAWKPIQEIQVVLALGGSADLLDNDIFIADLPELSGSPASRFHAVFRGGVQWVVW